MSWQRNLVNRRFAGNINTEDAFVTGYFYYFIDLNTTVLKHIFNRMSKLYNKYNNIDEDKFTKEVYQKLVAATCLAVTPPGGTLNVESLGVMGGIKFGTATNIDFPETYTTRHVELAGLPIFHFISAWINVIRDRNSGVSPLNCAEKGEYTKEEFHGSAYYIVTKPNGKDIELAMKFEGVFPTNDPIDKFGHDLATVNVLQHDITWRYDSVWCNHIVVDEAKKILEKGKYCKSHEQFHEKSII